MTISKSIFVKRPVEAAFRHFTADIGRWWPLKEGVSFGGERAHQVFIEGRVGGRFFERYSDGEEFEVGRVTAFEPPARVVFTWRPPTWSAATEVEVRFARGGRRHARHARAPRLGGARPRRPARANTGYGKGWDLILSRFAA